MFNAVVRVSDKSEICLPFRFSGQGLSDTFQAKVPPSTCHVWCDKNWVTFRIGGNGVFVFKRLLEAYCSAGQLDIKGILNCYIDFSMCVCLYIHNYNCCLYIHNYNRMGFIAVYKEWISFVPSSLHLVYTSVLHIHLAKVSDIAAMQPLLCCKFGLCTCHKIFFFFLRRQYGCHKRRKEGVS